MRIECKYIFSGFDFTVLGYDTMQLVVEKFLMAMGWTAGSIPSWGKRLIPSPKCPDIVA